MPSATAALQAAGFSPAEINSYAAQQRVRLGAAGFSQKEIDDYLGPQAVPKPQPDTREANASFSAALSASLVANHQVVTGGAPLAPSPSADAPQATPPGPATDTQHSQAGQATSDSQPQSSDSILPPVGRLSDAGQTLEDVATVYGPLEAAANAVTGMVGGAVGLIGGAGTAFDRYVLGNPNVDPKAVTQRLQSLLTYKPVSAAGQRLAEDVALPFETLARAGSAAGHSAADWLVREGHPDAAVAAGAITDATVQMLPAVLGGELVRKLSGQTVTADDMSSTAKVIAGQGAAPETVQHVENSLRQTYAKTGIGPFTVLQEAQRDPNLTAELKSPDISVPSSFQAYVRTPQMGLPVSQRMQLVRPLEAATPVPDGAPLPQESPFEQEVRAHAPDVVSTADLTPPPQEALQGAGLGDTPADRVDTALTARALQIDPQAVQEAAETHANDDGAFLGAVRSIVNGQDENAEAAAGSAGDELAGGAEPAADGADAAEGAAGAGEGAAAAEPGAAAATGAGGAGASLYPSGVVELNAGITAKQAADGMRQIAQDLAATHVGQKVASVVTDAVHDAQLKVTPMAAGSGRAMAIAKDAANAMRLAEWQWSKFDDLLRKGFTPEQRTRMWNAAEEENTLRTLGVQDSSRGLGSLTNDERSAVETLSQYGNQLLDRARKVGMFSGDGVPYWTPRMVAMIGEDGEVSMPPRQGEPVEFPKQGGNIGTSASSLRARKHATVEETEAAAKAKFGANAAVIRDIRTMPMAMARIERAIAGRELINRIKDVGQQVGLETVAGGEKPGFFTIDHPAFKTYRPRYVEQPDGSVQALRDEEGNTVLDRVPLWISKEFEGPLKAIMSERSGAIYKGLMSLKGKATSLIMYSPLIHNAVEWGRALPLMPGKVLTGRVYFEGNAAKNDPITMRRAIDAGLVPIGKRFFNQDITGLAERPEIQPGRSLTAKAVGGAVGLVNDAAGDAVKAAIDRAGDLWHNTLLWDRVGDLQMGLFTNIERDLVRKGVDGQTASRLAAHFANRYAGALPNEAMSAGARKLANLALFSRTYTLGNIGALKDMITGLPQDVQAQIERDAGQLSRLGAQKLGRQKAIHAFVMDVGLLYVGNAIMQNVMDHLIRNRSLPTILAGYALRFKDYLSRAETNPAAALDLSSLFPQSENEPGMENRVFFKTAPDGTGIYMRLPTGKVGEDAAGWLTSPLETLKRKQGTLARPLLQTLENDKGFGRKIYDDQEPGFKGMLDAAGNIAWNVLQQQVPLDSIQAGYRLLSGHGDETDALKTVGPLLGVTFSKGAPGGPQVGVMFHAEERHQNEVANAMPGIRRAIKDGDLHSAIQQMEAAHMTPAEQRLTLRYAMNPQQRLNRARLRKFEQIAPTDMLDRMEELQQREQEDQQLIEGSSATKQP